MVQKLEYGPIILNFQAHNKFAVWPTQIQLLQRH